MTVAQALAQFLQDNGFGTVGTNLFINSVPLEAPKASWWIVGGGGNSTIRAQTGEKVKAYIYTIFYRNTDASDVDSQLQNLEEFFNSKACKSLGDDYQTIDMESTGFQVTADLDLEDRSLGSIEVTITVYQS